MLAAALAQAESLAGPTSGEAVNYADFVPPLALSSAVAAWINETVRARAAWSARLGDRAISLQMGRLNWQTLPASAEMLGLHWEMGGHDLVLSLPAGIVGALLATVQPGLALPTEPARSLVLELALEPLLARLEARTGQTLRLLEVREAHAAKASLEFEIGFGPLRGKGHLDLFSPLDGLVPPPFLALGSLLNLLPEQARPLPEDFPVTAAAEIGTLRLAAGILRRARPGDVLLPQDCPLARGEIALVVGELWASAEVAGEHLRLRGRFHPRPNPVESSPMTAPTEPARSPAEMDLDTIEITLVFECGRWPMTLGALRAAGEGHVFELGRPLDGPVDIIANGRLIGRGDIVRVGDTLGVRLHGKLAGHA